MSLLEPPIFHPINDSQQKITLPWVEFFNNQYLGDTGEAWTPVFTSLTTVGSPSFIGRYYRISRSLVYFNIQITPATSTTATAGTTYCDFPLTVINAGFCVNIAGVLGGGIGIVTTNKRIYVPSWSAVTTQVGILGLVEAQ